MFVFFFFFKQKTAYEVRISGWSSDVCSSDLPDEYQKKKMPDRSTQRSVSEADMEIEWTRMIPKSSSKPHGLTRGKFFTDCGWMDVTRGGRRELSFKLDVTRSSGGHLDSK